MSEEQTKEEEYLLLKWGTLKGWKFHNDDTLALLQRYFDIGSSASAMLQNDTDEQKSLICQIIDAVDGEITSDWSGDVMTREEAKKYVLEYSR